MTFAPSPKKLSEVAALCAGENAADLYPAFVKEFLDALRKESLTERVNEMISDAPTSTGNQILDVHIAGLAEYIAFAKGAAVPEWTNGKTRFLAEPVYFGGGRSRPAMLATTSFSMRRRNLFCGPVQL